MSGVSRRIAAIAASGVWSPRARTRLLRAAGAVIGRARVLPGIRFIGDPSWLRVADGCFVNVELLVGAGAPVSIGTQVHIGPRCALLPGSHEIGDATRRAGANRADAITIGDGSWLGAGVTVLGGVTIGSGVIIAAGAVVTDDCESDAVYGGVPARRLTSLPSEASS